jgi:thiamine-phosphate pyrophosphorylase
MRLEHYKYYIFVNEFNKTIKKNLAKLSRPNLILNFKISDQTSLILAKNIIKFCKFYQIPFYIIDDIKIAKTLNANGIFISSNNRKIGIPLCINTKFKLIGSAHNQLEYFFKLRQKCKTIMLSPIFYNNKYSFNKILSPVKFNLISLNWKTDVCALGGISNSNIKKIKITKAKSIGLKSWINKKIYPK